MYQLTESTLIRRLSDGAIIPADPTNADYAAYSRWLAESNAPLPVPGATPEEHQAQFTAAIQDRLDAWARARNYDGILSACTYATDPHAVFAAEGRRAVDLRSQTWAAGYRIMGEVLAGTRPMPADLADIEPELPVLRWPDEDPA